LGNPIFKCKMCFPKNVCKNTSRKYWHWQQNKNEMKTNISFVAFQHYEYPTMVKTNANLFFLLKITICFDYVWCENRSPYLVNAHWSGKSSLFYWAVCFCGGYLCITTAWEALLGVCVRCCARKLEWRLLLNGHGGRLAAPNYD
jgi:hypothetical protein